MLNDNTNPDEGEICIATGLTQSTSRPIFVRMTFLYVIFPSVFMTCILPLLVSDQKRFFDTQSYANDDGLPTNSVGSTSTSCVLNIFIFFIVVPWKKKIIFYLIAVKEFHCMGAILLAILETDESDVRIKSEHTERKKVIDCQRNIQVD